MSSSIETLFIRGNMYNDKRVSLLIKLTHKEGGN